MSLVLFFGSCLDVRENDPTAYGDAFVRTIIDENDRVAFNLQLYAYSYSEMAFVEVSYENEKTPYVLDTFDYKYTFSYQPDVLLIDSIMPKSGQYYFDVTFEGGAYYHGADFLTTDYLEPANVTELFWNDDDKRITIKWENPNFEANLYGVILQNSDGETVFESELMEGDVFEFSITEFTYGWYTGKKPSETEEYTIVLTGYLFEPVVSSFDIQCIAVNNKEVFVWSFD